MDPVHILMDPIHGPGPRRGSMDQGSMFCTFPFPSVTVLFWRSYCTPLKHSMVSVQHTWLSLSLLMFLGELLRLLTNFCWSRQRTSLNRGLWRGGVLIPFPRKLFFQIPAQIPQPQPVLLKLKSHSHFSIVFSFMNPSPSAKNPISQPLKKANPSSHFTPSRPSKPVGLRAFSVCVPYLWNSFPFEIECNASVPIFKAKDLYFLGLLDFLTFSIFSFLYCCICSI